MGSIIHPGSPKPSLMIDVISEKAERLSNHTFMRYPKQHWETDGYDTMTWGQFGKSVDKIAHWLDQHLGKSSGNDTIAYLGPSDARYPIILAATAKAMRKVSVYKSCRVHVINRAKLLVPDGRLTKQGIHALIDATDCSAWLHAEEDDSGPRDFEIRERGVKTLALPSLEWCLDAQGTKSYPYLETFENGKDRVIAIIHTSGTTG
jgi:acyl-coenzyme A synthetase/AMP-(fatty) acid ligase